MCIIVIKKPDIKPPSIDVLKRQFNNNPDGCGFMYTQDNKVRVYKGFMKFEDFEYTYKKVLEDIGEKVPMIFHFRISTQAGVIPQFTHPFPYSTKKSDMELLSYTCPLAMAHNGVISLTSSSLAKDYTDTSKFVNEFLPLIIKDNLYKFGEDKRVMALIEKLVGASRLAFLDRNGTINTVGNFYEDKKTGLIFSNNTYDIDKTAVRKYVVTVPKKTLSTAEIKKKYECAKDNDGLYYFVPDSFCPKMDGGCGYCSHCAYKEVCSNVRSSSKSKV